MKDAATFDAFYASTKARTAHQMYALLGDLAEALDVTQDAYWKAWEDWSRVGAMADPQGWVRTVAWRLALNRVRHMRVVARSLFLRRELPGLPEVGVDNVLLIGALKRLPADQRRAVVLHYLVDLPVEQVAFEVGASISAVKSRLARGRAALLPILADEPSEESNA